jgi:hypothetical protein
VPDLISFGEESNELSCGANSSVISQASGLSQVSNLTDDDLALGSMPRPHTGSHHQQQQQRAQAQYRQQQQQARGTLPDVFSSLSVADGGTGGLGGLQPAMGAGALMPLQQQQQQQRRAASLQQQQQHQQQQAAFLDQQQAALYQQQQQFQQQQAAAAAAAAQAQQPPGMSLGSHAAWEIDPAEVTYGQRIGIGSYGEVYKGLWRGTEVAVKRFLEQHLSPQLVQVCMC